MPKRFAQKVRQKGKIYVFLKKNTPKRLLCREKVVPLHRIFAKISLNH